MIDEPPSPGTSFLLDGQAVLLEDYLDVRPERTSELGALLRDGRIEAGPWYVLADELIPSGEAIIRNLTLGRETLRRLGASAPPVLYCPDSFGHPAILPDIAAGFGYELILLWRGLGGARSPCADTVWWSGPSGSRAVTYHLPPDGYEFGSSLSPDGAAARARWAAIQTTLEPRACTGTSILLNGADHHARQRRLSDSIHALADAAAGVNVRAVSLREAARNVVREASQHDLPEISGELRDSYGYTWTLQGTLGTRAGQKRRNARLEQLLIRDVEPWAALHALRFRSRAASTSAVLRQSWKTLLRAHPHDTLCGTSIDAVAAAFDSRLASAEQQCASLRSDVLNDLVNHDCELARLSTPDWRAALVLRNPVPRRRSGVAALRLAMTIADVAVGPGSGARQGARRALSSWSVSGLPLQMLAHREVGELTESPRAYPDADVVAEADALAWVDDIGGYALQTRLHVTKQRLEFPHAVTAGEHFLENEFLRVDVDASGSVSVLDTKTGRMIERLFAFENHQDVGDLYTPAIRKAVRPLRFARSRSTLRGPLRGEIALEYKTFGSSRRRADWCSVALQLDAAAKFLRVVVSGENRSIDHRLRIRFDTGLPTGGTIADAAFLPVTRVPLRIDRAAETMERVVPTAPLHRWVARVATDEAFALASDGLAEYESMKDGAIAVTLVRAVGELSRADLPERPGHAGWPAPTPAAQSLGSFEANFAIAMLTGRQPELLDALEQFADDALLPIRGETLRSNLLDAQILDGIELRGDGLAFRAALPSSRDGWVTLRCVNLRAQPAAGQWVLSPAIAEATLTRLDETVLAPLPVKNGSIEFLAPPLSIVTIMVR